jgi:ParB family transcriptional regulator, chromosome partitioning protein
MVKRPSASNLFSTSSQAFETKQELAEAQQKIKQLEEELEKSSNDIRSIVGEDKVTQAVVPIEKILRRPYASRREKDTKEFLDLVNSIKLFGFRGSIWVQRLPDGQLRLIAGETRMDACLMAGLAEITVDIVDCDDVTAVKLSRIENFRRVNLNALDDTEELLYLMMLSLKKDRKQTIKLLYKYKNSLEGTSSIDGNSKEIIERIFEEVAPDIGVKTFVTSRLPLLELPDDVMKAYTSGSIEYSKALVLGRVEDATKRNLLIQQATENNLSLSALKNQINGGSDSPVISKFSKLGKQISSSLNSKSLTKLSVDQRSELRVQLRDLEVLLGNTLEELNKIDGKSS